MFIDHDLKWSTYVDYIYKKACKRLYSLRLLRRAGVSTTGMLKVYLSVIRPILEYAVPVWQSICKMQYEKLESIQKRALRVIFPTAETYKDALNLAGLETLARRTHLCEKYMNKMRCTNHPHNMLLPRRYEKNCEYALRDKSDETDIYRNYKFCNTKRSQEFFIFKYFYIL